MDYVAERRNWPLDFKFIGWEMITGKNGKPIKGWTVTSKKLGVTLRGERRQLLAVEICLPQLGWGHNCRLIVTPPQLQALFWYIQWLLGFLAKPVIPHSFIPGPWNPQIGKFTRIDIACDFHQHSGIWPLALNMEHPRIRSSRVTHAGESVILPGKKLKIQVYDKGKKSCLYEGGKLMRLEIQFRDKLLQDYCGDYLAFGINTDWAPLVFARVLTEIDEESARPVVSRSVPKRLVGFLAEMEIRAPMIPTTERYIYHMSRGGRTARELRKSVERHKLQQQQHRFKDLLESAVDLGSIIPRVKLEAIERAHREHLHQFWTDVHEQSLSAVNRDVSSDSPL